MSYVFQFLYGIVDALKQCTVPGFSFTFWDFAVGSFMLASGISFVSYMMKTHTENNGDKKK